jgi:hypothetical protein
MMIYFVSFWFVVGTKKNLATLVSAEKEVAAVVDSELPDGLISNHKSQLG